MTPAATTRDRIRDDVKSRRKSCTMQYAISVDDGVSLAREKFG
jgi:hypothetical protein